MTPDAQYSDGKQIIEQIINNSTVAIFIYSSGGIIKKINNAAIKLLGINGFEAIRNNRLFAGRFFNVIITDPASVDRGIINRLELNFDILKAGNYLETNRCGNTYVDISVSSFGESGILVEAREIIVQVSGRSVFSQNQGLFKHLADSAPVLIWMADVNKNCVYFNKGWLSFTGRAIEREIGDGWTENVHPDDLSDCYRIFSDNFDLRKQFKMEYRLRRHDGEYRWILDNGVPLFSEIGGFEGYIGSCIDITESKNAAMEIALSEDKFKRLFSNGPVGALIVSLKFVYTLANDAFCRFTGYSQEEIIGKTFLDITHPLDIEMGKKHAAELLSGEIKQAVYIKRYIHKEGKIVWGQVSITVIRDNCNKPLFYFQMVEDVTKRKIAERRLLHSERKYRNLVENAPFGVCIVLKEKMVYCNNKFKEMVEGESRTQVYNWRISDFVHKDDLAKAHGSYLLRKEGKTKWPFVYEFKAVTIKGNNRIWKVYNTEYYEEEKKFQQSLIFDITDDVKLENNRRYLLTESILADRKNKLAGQLEKILLKTVSSYGLKEKDKKRIDKAFQKFLSNETDWDRFNIHFEGIYGNFLTRLKKMFPLLTQNELRHCAYIKLKFTTKDIALLTNVQDTSVQRSRVRLKKKLNLSQKQDLYIFLEYF
jgi:PAS domain S-box-containing protein